VGWGWGGGGGVYEVTRTCKDLYLKEKLLHIIVLTPVDRSLFSSFHVIDV
jgi:hypothetical protein